MGRRSTMNLFHHARPMPVVSAMFWMCQVIMLLFRTAQRYLRASPVIMNPVSRQYISASEYANLPSSDNSIQNSFSLANSSW